MSKFMAIAGILAAAAGVALALMGYVSPGPLQVVGLTPEVAAILLIGGLGLIGIGGIISAIEQSTRATRDLRHWMVGEEAAHTGETVIAAATAVTVGQAAEEIAEKAEEAVKAARASTSETIAALDKAKEDISKALGVGTDAPAATTPPPPIVPPVVTPPPPPAAKEEPPPAEIETAEVDEEQLFVVDEKVIRGRPARVLSDGTVEAETDEGWMRFENLEHLEEYLDSVTPSAKA